MAASKKIHYIKCTHKERTTMYAGTIDYLNNRVFGYTLECGNSWNRKINRFPKTAKSLVKALNDSAYECNRYYDSYDLSSKEEFENFTGTKSMMDEII
jgi:hypothetical protein